MQVDLTHPKITIELTVNEAILLVDDIDENDKAVSVSTLLLGHRLGEILETAGYLDDDDEPEPTPPANPGTFKVTGDPSVQDWGKILNFPNGARLA